MLEAEEGWKAVALLDTEITLSTFEEDSQGELYIAHYAEAAFTN